MDLQALLKEFSHEMYVEQHSSECLTFFYASHAWATFPGGICTMRSKEHLHKALANSNIVGIIIKEELKKFLLPSTKLIIVAENPNKIFDALYEYNAHLPKHYVENFIADSANIHPTAVIEEHVHIGERVSIGPFCVIRANTFIDDDVQLASHVAIGEQGICSKIIDDKRRHKQYYGGVKIGKRCSIGTHSIVVKGWYYQSYTEINDDASLACNCSVGHNATVGKCVRGSSYISIGGFTHIGDYTWIGLGAIISNSLEIGEKASVKIGSVLVNNVADGAVVSGNFAIPHRLNLKRTLMK